MNTTTKHKPVDQVCSERLKRLPVGKPFPLPTDVNQTAWYRAARILGVKISIRSLPSGLVLFRLS
jgi:hypothetical protein